MQQFWNANHHVFKNITMDHATDAQNYLQKQYHGWHPNFLKEGNKTGLEYTIHEIHTDNCLELRIFK